MEKYKKDAKRNIARMKRLEDIEADLAETVQRQTEFFIKR